MSLDALGLDSSELMLRVFGASQKRTSPMCFLDGCAFTIRVFNGLRLQLPRINWLSLGVP